MIPWWPSWTPEHPIEVRFPDGVYRYLAEDVAVADYAERTGLSLSFVEDFLLIFDEPMVTATGARYCRLSEAPVFRAE